jgi:hypothetical protein
VQHTKKAMSQTMTLQHYCVVCVSLVRLRGLYPVEAFGKIITALQHCKNGVHSVRKGE